MSRMTDRHMKILYIDCSSGASGDMMLGALIDAGLPLDELRRALGSLAMPGYELGADRVLRAGVSATKFRVHPPGPDHEPPEAHRHDRAHGHTHGHGHDHAHAHRSLAAIEELIDRSALSAPGREKARRLFRRLAEAEAAIHDVPLERVHLHEVGALDSIVDIVGGVFGLEWLAADRIVSSPLNVGSGTVVCAHGTFPVPAPATARLLTGAPVYSTGIPFELVTPTGALLVSGHAHEYGPLPPMTIEQVGYGAGDRDLEGVPNVLRLLVGSSATAGRHERAGVLEFEVDDMNPQIFGPLMERLYGAGAAEVFYTPVQMKKSRPGTLVTAIAAPERREALTAIVFRETTTIGVRYQEVDRECLAREVATVETPVGPVRIKIARRGGRVLNASPEFDDLARLASQRNLSIKEVQAIAMKAYLDTEAGKHVS